MSVLELPFSQEQFFGLFETYNLAVWPAQLVAATLSVLAVAALACRMSYARFVCLSALAALWAWTGAVYHAVFLSAINPAAKLFGAIFLIQASVLLHRAVRNPAPDQRNVSQTEVICGWTLVGYAAVVYPIIMVCIGHHYSAMPTFGITPCPLTIFSIGLLLLLREADWSTLAIPTAWAIVGGSAAFLLGVLPDLALPVAVAIANVAMRMTLRATPTHRDVNDRNPAV